MESDSQNLQVPENLIEAVGRLGPQAILILDANTIMANPRIESYEVGADGPFLIVIPVIALEEIRKISRGDSGREVQRRASRAKGATDRLCDRGDPARGIDLGGGRWLITARSPQRASHDRPEDDLILRTLGKPDAAVLRLADSLGQHCPDSPAMLVTGDNDLRRAARVRGVPACRLHDLRGPESIERLLPADLPSVPATLPIPDPDEERKVHISMKLEELRAELEELVARGSGILAYDGGRYPFRWTFPFEDLSGFEMREPGMYWPEVNMPLENVDFMGSEESLPTPVRRLVCRMLEGAGEGALQSPLTRLRFDLAAYSLMGDLKGGIHESAISTWTQSLSPEDANRLAELTLEQDSLMRCLLGGTAENFGETYRSVFRLYESIEELRVWGEDWGNPEHFGWDASDLESVLSMFLGRAIDSWSVGETRQEEHTHSPFEWLEPEEMEAQAGKED